MRAGCRKFFWKLLAGCGGCLIVSTNVMAANNPILHNKHHKQGTQIHLITPFSSAGVNSKVKIVKTLKGTCWTTSQADPARPNTWRCNSGSTTFDPCFVNPARETDSVICLNSPWDQKAVQLKLNTPVPSNKTFNFHHRSTLPWALELANGSLCTLITGPSLAVAGMKTSYKCSDGGVVIGEIDRSRVQWAVLFQKNDALFMAQTDILKAWY